MFDKDKALPSVAFDATTSTVSGNDTTDTQAANDGVNALSVNNRTHTIRRCDNVVSIQGESLRVVANRADVLWQRAVKTLKARDNHFPAVHLSYWDSYGNKPQPPHPMGGQVLVLKRWSEAF